MPHISDRGRFQDGNAVRDSNAVQRDCHRYRGHRSAGRNGYVCLQIDLIPGETVRVPALQSKNSGSQRDDASLVTRNRHDIKREGPVQRDVGVAAREILCHCVHPAQFTKPLFAPHPQALPPHVKIGVRPYTGVVGTGQLFSLL